MFENGVLSSGAGAKGSLGQTGVSDASACEFLDSSRGGGGPSPQPSAPFLRLEDALSTEVISCAQALRWCLESLN